MPISIVTKIPPGSLPGMMSLASAPTTSPISAVQRRLSINTPSVVSYGGCDETGAAISAAPTWQFDCEAIVTPAANPAH